MGIIILSVENNVCAKESPNPSSTQFTMEFARMFYSTLLYCQTIVFESEKLDFFSIFSLFKELRDHKKEREGLYWEVYIGRVYTGFFRKHAVNIKPFQILYSIKNV